MKTLAIKIKSNNFEEEKDLILAYLSDLNFEGFIEQEDSLIGYIRIEEFDNFKSYFQSIKHLFTNLIYETEFVEEKNWNEVWESNYEPVIINDQVLIKAPFHKISNKYEYEITINPKMAFGTGHHPTTAAMIELMIKHKEKFINKKIADIGCGTGILSIMASKLNAKNIVAIDISTSAIENTIENANLNNIKNINCYEGSIETIINEKFDILLANLTRNLILEQINIYSEILLQNGLLFLSGILSTDDIIVIKEASKFKFKFSEKLVKNEWCALLFLKLN